MLKIFFAGGDGFAVPILEKLMAAPDIKIELVITRPAKPAGRGLKPEPNPVLAIARRLHLPVIMVDKKADWSKVNKEIKNLKPDYCVVAALGRIIPATTLELLPHKFINIHPSLLPKYRGPSPIESSLLDGLKATGVSFMILSAEMDAGPILRQYQLGIKHGTDALELSEELSELAASHMVEVLEDYPRVTPVPQKDAQATYTRIITKSDGKIDLEKDTAADTNRKVKAYRPWPGVTIELGDTTLKLIKTDVDGTKLVIDAIQPAGKRVLDAREFANGYRKLLTKFPPWVTINPLRMKSAKDLLPKDKRK
ncbi:MAG TPA: methionyl-tRNA formyltransferase [Patescibacteria group bacterium]|nr:methionyl-tRNA formyltransferase [Patescibacteria group bacterium]